MKLKDMVELLSNNDACVVLKVKDGQEMNLISLGCFNGDEVMMRLTKGRDVTCTLFRKNGKSFSWHWGASGFTLVTDQVWRMGQLIQSCIENDFGIKCKYCGGRRHDSESPGRAGFQPDHEAEHRLREGGH